MATRRPRFIQVVLLLLLAVVVEACDVFYFAQAHVPLMAPLDTSCVQTELRDGGGYRRIRTEPMRGTETSVVAYGTPAMFHNQWSSIVQIVQRDSGVYRGTLHRDSSATLVTSYVQVNRRIPTGRAASMTAEMSDYLLHVRDACGGRSPGGERLFSAAVTVEPYRAWVVRGTSGRLAMRLIVDSVRYWLMVPRNEGRAVLRLDTLARDSTRYARWITVDTLVLPPRPPRTTIAIDCGRGDSMATGAIVAFARETDTEYLGEIGDAWAIDRSAFRIRRVSTDGVECRQNDWYSVLPDAPRSLRAAALTHRPPVGSSRIYVLAKTRVIDLLANVAVDSQLVGRVKDGSFLMIDVPPGRHRVSVPVGARETALLLDAAPDRAYYVLLRDERSFLTRRTKLEVLDQGRAREQIRLAQMTSSSWPGTPMRGRGP